MEKLNAVRFARQDGFSHEKKKEDSILFEPIPTAHPTKTFCIQDVEEVDDAPEDLREDGQAPPAAVLLYGPISNVDHPHIYSIGTNVQKFDRF